jgi:hypothetical protein
LDQEIGKRALKRRKDNDGTLQNEFIIVSCFSIARMCRVSKGPRDVP